MIEKEFKTCGEQQCVLVRFILPSRLPASCVHVVGDFNGWDRSSHPLWRDRDGQWVQTVLLQSDRLYWFRYLVDRKQWLNDHKADAFVHISEGISCSAMKVVMLSPLPEAELRAFFDDCKVVLVPELNYEGQFANLVSGALGKPVVRLNRTIATPMPVAEIMAEVRRLAAEVNAPAPQPVAAGVGS